MGKRKKLSLIVKLERVAYVDLTCMIATGVADALMYLDAIVGIYTKRFSYYDFSSDWNPYAYPIKSALAKKALPVVAVWDEKYGRYKTRAKRDDHIWARHDLLSCDEFVESLINVIDFLWDPTYGLDDTVFNMDDRENFGKAIGIVYTLNNVSNCYDEEIVLAKYVNMRISLLNIVQDLFAKYSAAEFNN